MRGKYVRVLNDLANRVEFLAVADTNPDSVQTLFRQGMRPVVFALIVIERLVEVIQAHDGAGVVASVGKLADDFEVEIDPLVVNAGEFETLADLLVQGFEL